jgi:hypothetical protein
LICADAFTKAFAAAAAAAAATAAAKMADASAAASVKFPISSDEAQRQIGRYLQWAEFRGGILNASSSDVFARCDAERLYSAFLLLRHGSTCAVFAGACTLIAGTTLPFALHS